jgi:DNA repair photolyase
MTPKVQGRGSSFNPPNRFEALHLEPVYDELDGGDATPKIPTMYYRDTSRSILAKNDSPDLPFTYSINPYRGCEHGCIYCYARPSHEYLGFSAGLDFETKIMVKMEAPELLTRTLGRKRWKPQMVAFSGNTDCYQPAERQLGLTRRCLEVFLRFRNPISLVTKNSLVLRDLDLLRDMAALNLVHVMVSVTSLDPELIRAMEPRASSPARRLETIRELASNGIPVGVNAAPIIPGLTDEELPAILKAASEQGATSASYILVKLPGAVEALFLDWLERVVPARAGKIVNRIRDTRRGKLHDSRFGTRMTGEGEIAQAIATLFDISARRHNLDQEWQRLSTEHFCRTMPAQLQLFTIGHS